MKGVDLRSVQQFAGHKTISMTMRYSHLAPSHLAAAIEKLCEPTAIPTASGTDEAQEVKAPRLQ
jgi:integrase